MTSKSTNAAFAPHYRKALLGFTALTMSLTAMAGQTVTAQDGGASLSRGIDEVLVTARKREESLQDTPVAVTAFTGDNLSARGISDVSQIADYTPNMQMDFTAPITGSSNAATIFIRGVGQTDFLMSIDPGVGVYIDGVYLARSMGSVLDLLDVERIEVLRGPQGTLFGKNTIGGAINVTTKKPADEFEAVAELTAGSFDRLDFNGSVNLPLVQDKLALRVSATSKNADGWAKRADGAELGDENTDAVRGTLLWQAADNVEAVLSVDGTRSRESSPVSTLLFVDPAAQLTGLYNGFVAAGPAEIYDPRYVISNPDVDGVVNMGTDPIGSELDILGTSLAVNWDFDAFSVKAIAAYRDMEVEFGNDIDQSPLPILATYTTMEHEQTSFEINVSGSSFDDRLEWLIGGYYFQEEGSNDTDAFITPGLFGNAALEAFALGLPAGPDQTQLLGLVNAGSAAAGINTVDNTSYAGFVHASYEVTDKLSLTFGLRYTHEEKKALNQSNFKNLVDTLPPGAPIPEAFFVITNRNWEDTFNNMSPHLNVEYRWNDDILTYASYSKGFKSGGVGERYRIPRLNPVAFEPEEVASYEVGLKGDFLDNLLRVNVAAFLADYSEIQVSTVRDVEPLTFNAAEAEIKGIEVEVIAAPTDNLTLTGGVGFIDAEYTKLDPGVIIGMNNKFVDTPEWSANILAEYVFPVGNSGEMTLRADYSYRSEVANDAVNTAELIQDGYGLFNAGVTYELLDKNISFTLFGRNLSDEEYIVSGWADKDALGLVQGTWGRPREWGISAKVSF